MVDKITQRERIVLEFLSPLMDATSRRVGEHVLMHKLGGGSNISGVGAAICGRLRKRGLVTFDHNQGWWRVTAKGRQEIAT